MKLNKSVLTTNGEHLQIAMPIVKVDRENRTVSGFATLDNVDTQKDVVTADASRNAFARWRGNVREMHAPIAVGKALKFEEKTFFNPDDGQTYNGMYVTVYVSKGAEDTWQKVLDGTLTGFSIGGGVIKARDIFDKASNTAYREVEDYELTELSLVDNPANQLANIMSFQKVNGQTEMTGMLSKMAVENIFWCPTDLAKAVANAESLTCASCGNDMENIGWVEAEDDQREEVIAKAVATKTSNQPNAGWNTTATGMTSGYISTTPSITINGGVDAEQIAERVVEYLRKYEGGVDVSKRTVRKSADEQPEATAEAVVEATPAAGPSATTTEKAAGSGGEEKPEAATVSEVDEPDFAKMFSDLREALAGAIETSKADTQQILATVQETIEKSVGEVSTKVSEFETKLGELKQQVDSLDDTVDTVEKRVDGVEGETAIKKSGDLGGSKDEDTTEKFWRGSFLGAEKLVN